MHAKALFRKCRRAAALGLVASALLAGCTTPAPAGGNRTDAARLEALCPAHGPALLAARNALETARASLRASKDNFGPGREAAIEATEQAIASLLALAAVEPDPDTRVAHFAGQHRHPHMQVAYGALRDARAAVEQLDCFTTQARAPVQAAIDQAIAGIVAAFQFNPPGSGN
ncbi:MAG: hypothetical protein JO369_05780 [Paucibacter sp.]|nr:hypothetical protein [Roseateles sp.]